MVVIVSLMGLRRLLGVFAEVTTEQNLRKKGSNWTYDFYTDFYTLGQAVLEYAWILASRDARDPMVVLIILWS